MPDTTTGRRTSWRDRMYGRCRMRGWNRLAWLFADRRSRAMLGHLRAIKRDS